MAAVNAMVKARSIDRAEVKPVDLTKSGGLTALDRANARIKSGEMTQKSLAAELEVDEATHTTHTHTHTYTHTHIHTHTHAPPKGAWGGAFDRCGRESAKGSGKKAHGRMNMLFFKKVKCDRCVFF